MLMMEYKDGEIQVKTDRNNAGEIVEEALMCINGLMIQIERQVGRVDAKTLAMGFSAAAATFPLDDIRAAKLAKEMDMKGFAP